jgi:hypothetical protein
MFLSFCTLYTSLTVNIFSMFQIRYILKISQAVRIFILHLSKGRQPLEQRERLYLRSLSCTDKLHVTNINYEYLLGTLKSGSKR